MVKISYSPATELIVHDFIKVSKEELLRSRVTPSGNMPLYWCDGMLYGFASPPLNDEVVSEMLKGKIHWLEVMFTTLDKYSDVLSLNEEEYKAQMNFRIINTISSQLHRDFIKWLKTVSK